MSPELLRGNIAVLAYDRLGGFRLELLGDVEINQGQPVALFEKQIVGSEITMHHRWCLTMQKSEQVAHLHGQLDYSVLCKWSAALHKLSQRFAVYILHYQIGSLRSGKCIDQLDDLPVIELPEQ